MTACTHDALRGREGPAPVRIAVVGGGPRGLSVVEQLILACNSPITIDVFDSRFVGGGRIWHPAQSPHLLMNTHAAEVTIFSGPMDDGPVRAGAGPSLEQWLAPDDGVYSGYAARADYGKYLRFAFEAVVANAPDGVTVNERTDTVTSIRRNRETKEFVVQTTSGQSEVYRAVVLATGHPQPLDGGVVATHRPGSARVIAGDSAADLPLDEVLPGQNVAALGMGLAFHDLVALLTQGRGGTFDRDDLGRLDYRPSGQEPSIVGISRSGLPIPSRGRNQKPANFTFTPRLCTVERMAELRRDRQVDFEREVAPWVLAEAAASFCLTKIANGSSPALAEEFASQLITIQRPDPVSAVYELANAFGVEERLPTLESLGRPFDGVDFSSRGSWHEAVVTYLETDLRHAREGNVTNPLKAALDTLRDLRPSLRAAVEFGGITPKSHEDAFLGRFVPMYSLLVAGPPPRRIEELLALIRAGIVTIAGPGARIVDDGRTLAVRSPAVPGAIAVERVIDARIPKYEVGRCQSVLYPQLLADGLVRRFRHVGATASVETGACDVDSETGYAIGANGEVVPGLVLLGIPTERLRWFTQIGNGRPSVRSGFTVDAEKAARSALIVAREVHTV